MQKVFIANTPVTLSMREFEGPYLRLMGTSVQAYPLFGFASRLLILMA